VTTGGSDEAVEDFKDIDPRYGTLLEFESLVAILKGMGKFFLVIQFYFQSVLVYSANCVKTYTVPCRRMLTSIGSRPLVAFGNKT
jgi:hypothetical protein